MTPEEWRTVKDYNDYEVSNYGRVRTNKRKNQIYLSQHDNGSGYLQVGLYKDGQKHNKYVHRLVLEAFVPNPYGFNQTNHRDENPYNNHVSNLEWCNAKYNNSYGTRLQRLSQSLTNNPKKSKQVAQIDAFGFIINIFPSAQEAQRRGYQQSHISDVCNHKRNTHKGFKWEWI